MARRQVVWSLLIVLALLSGGGWAAAAMQTGTSDGDYSLVIAQGSVDFPEADLIWQFHNLAMPAESDPAHAAGPGFAIIDEGSILASGVAGYDQRLAAGEAAFLPQDGDLSLLNLSESESTFHTLLLDERPHSDGTGSVTTIGQSFAAPAGTFEFELLRNVLTKDESATIDPGDQPAILYLQSGEIELTSGSSEPIGLPTGEATALTTETAVTVTGDRPAVIYLARIGDQIDNAPAQAATPTVDTPVSIEILTYLCPAGVTLEAAVPELCGNDQGLGSALFSISGGTLEAPASAQLNDGRWQWHGLDSGNYVIAVDTYPTGYARYAIDLNPNAGHFDENIEVTIDDPSVPISLNVYFLDPAEGTTGAGTVGVTFFDCPAGTTRDDLTSAADPGCSELLDVLPVTLESDQLSAALSEADLMAVQPQPSLLGSWEWSGLPAGAYRLLVSAGDAGDQVVILRPCGDQSCAPLGGDGAEATFDLADDSLSLLIYRIPAE